MKKFHSHHTTPVHKGGKDSPQVPLLDYEHAQLHAERFLNDEDNWFHGGLLFLLEPEVEKLVRQKYSEVQKQKYEDGTHPFCDLEPWTEEQRKRHSEKYSGPGNPMFGVEPTVKGWNWWTDGTTDLMSEKQPGPNFVLGRTNVSRGHDGVKGQHWFNNGTDEVLSFTCPEGFVDGRLPGTTRDSSKRVGVQWFNDGTNEVQSFECPEGFTRGRLPNKGNQWKPVKLLDTHTGETLHFESYKLCYTFLEVTKKVFMNRLHKTKLVHSRYLPVKG